MKKTKLVWRVSPEPQGRYRSFENRPWPSVTYGTADGRHAAFLECEDEYVPSMVRNGSHKPLKIIVLHHQHPEANGSWKRYVLKRRAATLDEAKALIQEFVDTHPDWHPKEEP